MHNIYIITNKVNGKLYVGQTIQDLSYYLKQQGYRANNSHSGKKPKLYNAIKKHGILNFTIELLCVCENQENANFCEIAFIAALKTQDIQNGYNVADGGGGKSGVPAWNKGKIMTEAFRSNISKAQKYRYSKIDTIPFWKGKPRSQETKDKIRATMKELKIAPSLEARKLGGKHKRVPKRSE